MLLLRPLVLTAADAATTIVAAPSFASFVAASPNTLFLIDSSRNFSKALFAGTGMMGVR